MATTVVTPVTPPAAAAPPVVAAPAAPTAAELAALKTELDAAKTAAAEHERTAKFWYDKASKGAAPEKPAAAATEDEADLLDLITSKGEKGLDALLKKRGFITREEAQGITDAKASQITTEAKLVQDYPDLANEKSEFFKTTAQFYGELKAEGVPERAAMKLAAQQAKLAGLESGTIKTPAQKTADQAAERAADRAARAAAGAGDHGGRTASEEDDDTPSADEQVAIQRLADALEIPLDKATERYKARAKKGVQVAVKIGR